MAQVQKIEPSTWVGWVFFGATMALIIGIMHVIIGLVAIFDSDFYLATSMGVVAFNITTWGWIHLAAGILLLATGAGILAGAMWARVVGVFLGSLAVIANIAFLPTFPLWSIIGVILSFFVVYALAMHGNEVNEITR